MESAKVERLSFKKADSLYSCFDRESPWAGVGNWAGFLVSLLDSSAAAGGAGEAEGGEVGGKPERKAQKG